MNISRETIKSTLRTIMAEESEYQTFFKKALEKAGKSIPSMSDEEKKEFFNKIDAAWNAKGEKNEGNAFGAAVVAAKEKGKDEFEVGGKTYKVEESASCSCGCGGCNESVNEAVSKTYKIPTQRGTLHIEVEEDTGGVMVDVIFNRVDLSTTDIQFPTGDVEITKRKKKVKLKESVNEESINEARTVSKPIKVDDDTMVQIVGDNKGFRELTAALNPKTGKPIQKFGYERGNEIADSKEELIKKLQKKYGKSIKFESVNEAASDRDFEKVYSIFDKKDYFGLKGSIKTMLGNWQRALDKGDKGAQQYSKEDVIDSVTAQTKARAKHTYDELVKAIKNKDIKALKSKLRHDQTFSLAIFTQVTGKKLPKSTRDIHSFLDNEFMNESITEGRAFINAARKAKEEGKTEFEFNGKTYPVTLKESLNEDANMNKKVKQLLDKNLKELTKGKPNHQFAVMHILMGALSDANFHSEAKQVAKLFPRAKYEGDPMAAKDVEEYYHYELGPDVANICKWDGKDIVMAMGFYISMTIGRPLGQKVETLVESLTEARLGKVSLLKTVEKGDSSRVEGVKISPELAFELRMFLQRPMLARTRTGIAIDNAQMKDAIGMLSKVGVEKRLSSGVKNEFSNLLKKYNK